MAKKSKKGKGKRPLGYLVGVLDRMKKNIPRLESIIERRRANGEKVGKVWKP